MQRKSKKKKKEKRKKESECGLHPREADGKDERFLHLGKGPHQGSLVDEGTISEPKRRQ